MTLQLVMHEAFPEGDIAAAKRIAREFDEAAEVSATYATMAVDPVLVILIFIGTQFSTGFLGKAGEDAWDALKGLVRRLRNELDQKSQILVEDDEGLQLILGPNSPAEALASLPEDVRQAAGESGQLNWDEADGRWKSPF